MEILILVELILITSYYPFLSMVVYLPPPLHLLLTFFYVEIKRKFNKDISGNPVAIQKLKTACERAKRMLSFSLHASIEIDSLIDGLDFRTTVSRVGFIFVVLFTSLFIMGF